MLFSQPAVGSQQKTDINVFVMKADDGRIKGNIAIYCKVLHVSSQAFNKFLKAKDTPGNLRHWQMQCRILAAKMNAMTLMEESVCIRPYSSNSLREYICPVRAVYRAIAELVLIINQNVSRMLITKADREASKSDDLIKRDFAAEKPLEKCMTDMTEIKASDGKLHFQLSLILL